jgi:hypothetical protein
VTDSTSQGEDVLKERVAGFSPVVSAGVRDPTDNLPFAGRAPELIQS